MKPVRLFKKLGAAFAVGLIALGLIAGTASTATADGVSGEISRVDSGIEQTFGANGGVSGEISQAPEATEESDATKGGVSGEISDAVFAKAVSGEIS